MKKVLSLALGAILCGMIGGAVGAIGANPVAKYSYLFANGNQPILVPPHTLAIGGAIFPNPSLSGFSAMVWNDPNGGLVLQGNGSVGGGHNPPTEIELRDAAGIPRCVLYTIGPNSFSCDLVGTGTYSVAGTPLPTCNAAIKGVRAYVSDATAPTYHAAYAGSGAVGAGVACDGSIWRTE